MATLRNIGPCALLVPALGNRRVGEDELVEVDNDIARGFLGQPDWQVELDDDDPRLVPELRKALGDAGLPTSGRRAELLERLATAPVAEPVDQAAAAPAEIEES